MINSGCYFSLINFEPSLVARCLLDDKSLVMTLKNTLSLSCASKVYYYIVYSMPFFRSFVNLVPFANLKNFQLKDGISFKNRFVDLRDFSMQKSEIFPGVVFGDAVVGKVGVELFSFDKNEIKTRVLKTGLKSNTIQIPEGVQSRRGGPATIVERSNDFLAIKKRYDEVIYIYTPDGQGYLGKCEVSGGIKQMEINKKLLYVVESCDSTNFNLHIFNLDTLENHEPIITIALPGSGNFGSSPSILFGNDCLICMDTYNLDDPDRGSLLTSKIYALPTSCLVGKTGVNSFSWIEGDVMSLCHRWIFPKDNDFIEVVYSFDSVSSKAYSFEISEISICQERLTKTTINTFSFPLKDHSLETVFFDNDRLFFAYQGKDTVIYSYDVLLGKTKILFPSPEEEISSCFRLERSSFQPRFLKTASDIRYLMMGRVESETEADTTQGRMITLTFV